MNELNNQKYSAVIFDLDGTLLDTLRDLRTALNYTLSKNHFPVRSLSEVRDFVGNGIHRLILRGIGEEKAAALSSSELSGIYEDFKFWYTRHQTDETHPYDGILPALAALKQQGISTAVLSNKADEAVKKLCDHFFPGLFTLCVGERDGIPRKPSPAGIFEILETLKCAPMDAVYIGDSEVDIETAKNAGIDGIFVAWGFREEAFLRARGAERILHTPKDLLPSLGLGLSEDT